MSNRRVVGNLWAATYVGIPVDTWRGYVARKKAPPPDDREIDKGHALPVWYQSTLDEWQSNRRPPGRPRAGARP